jgi:hypothetical protein
MSTGGEERGQMKDLRRGRKAVVGGLTVLGALIGLVLFVVLPALATPPGVRIPPPSSKGITPIDVPTGGQSDDCAVFYAAPNSAGKPLYQYRISNPKTKTYSTTVNGVTVTFTVTMNPTNPPPGSGSLPAYANDKYVSFSSTGGAAIVDVGIKGGTDTARYNYAGFPVPGATNTNYGSVSSDGYLHAPAQSFDSNNNPTSLYSVSNLTFCFNLAGSASGTVYRDVNENGTKDTSESGQSGWTVNLYSSPSSTPVATTTSGSTGSYSFVVPFSTGTTYRICEAPPSGTWAQSQPLPSTPNLCTAATELKKGYSFVPTSATQSFSGNDFGNVQAIQQPTCPPTTPFGTTDESYVIQLAACKPDQQYVFNSGTDGGKPFASVWAADELQANVPMVERIRWSFAGNTQNPFTVIYDDTFPFSRADAVPMHYCKVDPRTSEFDLDPQFNDLSEMGAVLPGSDTSCLISTTESADTATNMKFVAYVYSSIDGWRGTG